MYLGCEAAQEWWLAVRTILEMTSAGDRTAYLCRIQWRARKNLFRWWIPWSRAPLPTPAITRQRHPTPDWWRGKTALWAVSRCWV